MKEEPKSIWKTPLKGRMRLYAWLVLTIATFFIILIVVSFLPGDPRSFTDCFGLPVGKRFPAAYLLVSAVIAVIFLGLWSFVCWVWCWRNFKKFLFGCACVATLIALFYAEEDLRGKYDWESYKRDLEAKGEKFDWPSFIPTPVPDDQNFAMSPVWIARIKYNFQNEPQKAEAWYGDRINSDDVTKFMPLMPPTSAAIVGTNWANQHTLPTIPDSPIRWTAARVIDLKPWQSYYRNLEEKYPDAEISITPQPQSPAADVLLALSKFDPAIEQLRKDSQLPYSRFPVQYDVADPAEILLPHLAALKQCSQVLELRAIAELQSGQTDKASDDVNLMLRLANSIQTEPFIITHLVRMVIMQMAIQCIYEGLSGHQWSDAQLAGMDSELAKINYPADYQHCIQTERAAHIQVLEWVEQKRSRGRLLSEDILNYANQHTTESIIWLLNAAFYLEPKGWFYQGDILMSEAHQTWSSVPTGDAPWIISPQAVLQASNTAAKILSSHRAPFNFLGRSLTPELSNYAKRTAFAQESADLARVAIALERCYLAHGAFPNSLDALSPQFMQQVPHDIIDGGPLHYRLTEDGRFVLYSVGWNGTDDGGVAVSGKSLGESGVIIDQGDWVWRYPKKK